jgi:predicted aspartyl protease
MIGGVVPTGNEAVISLAVHHASGEKHDVFAVINTGFTDLPTLPRSLIVALGLIWRGSEEAILGDGSVTQFDYFDADIDWDGSVRSTSVHATDGDPLVGMALLAGYELTIQVVPGGRVTIAALP